MLTRRTTRALLVTASVVLAVAAAWLLTSGPAMFVAFLGIVDVGAWVVARAWSSAPRRLFLMACMAVHGAVLLVVGLLEVPVVLGVVDFRLVFHTPILAPTRDPSYLPDPELLYLPRPRDRKTGIGRSDISFSFHVPDPELYPYDVTYDGRGFRNPAALDHADVAVVGDSFVANNYVAADEAMTSVLARDISATVYNLGLVGYGPQQEAALVRRFALPLAPRVVVWIFFEGNDLTDVDVYRTLTSDFNAARSARHGIAARSFTRNAAESLMNLLGNPRPSAVARSAWWTAPGRRERLYFLYPARPLTAAAEAALSEVESIVGDVVRRTEAAGARFVLAFAPDKFRATQRALAFESGTEAAGWMVNDLPDRMAAMAARLPGRVVYLDLTPALVARANVGELPYFREDTHWNAAGNRIVAEALASRLRPLLAGAASLSDLKGGSR